MARAPAPLLLAILAVTLPAPAQDRVAAGSSAAGDIRMAVAQALRDEDAPVEFMASDIAARHGRDAVPHLVEALLRFDAPPKTPPTNENAALRVINRAMVFALDPRDEHHLRGSECWSNWANGTRLAAAALADLGGDDRRGLLIDLATGHYARGDYFAGQASSIPCGVLRADADPDGLLKRVESALPGAARQQQAHLRALQSSLKYRLAMDDPGRRDAYAAFEKKLWRTWALTPPNYSTVGGLEYSAAARALLPLLADADGQFVLRIWRDETTAPEETAIAHRLAVFLNDPQLNAGLKGLAATDSPRAAAATSALKEMDRRDASPGGIRRNPSPGGGGFQ
jgi:hypothetical protein